MSSPRRRPRLPRAAVTAVAVAATALAGCLPAPAEDPVVSWREPAAPPASTTPTPVAPAEITLAFGGDVHFTGRTRRLLEEPGSAVGPFASVLERADFAMVNLETAVTERGTPEPKRYLFRAPPGAYDALRAAGIDAVSLANNHALDYGRVGLRDTLTHAVRAGMPVVGAGRDAPGAYRPYVTTVAGTRLAVLGFSQVGELADSWVATGDRSGIATAFDAGRAAGAVRAARQQADVVLVYLHWGQEGNPCPTPRMRTLAELLADAGADVLVGTHAHVPMGGGWIDDTYVHWGLGNFVWYSTSHSTDTGVLRLTLRRDLVTGAEFLPGVVAGTGQPVPVDGAEREAVQRRLAQAAQCSGLADRPTGRGLPPPVSGDADH